MTRRLPPLNALRAFEAAARHLSFTKAADELNVTPAAISHQVKRLEEHLGVPLFRRLPHGLLLTESGQRLLLEFAAVSAVIADLIFSIVSIIAYVDIAVRWTRYLILEVEILADVARGSRRLADVSVDYANMGTGRRARLSDGASVSFT